MEPLRQEEGTQGPPGIDSASSRELVVVDLLLTPSRLRAGNPGSPFIASLWLTFGMTVTASEELFAPVGREVELCYQTFGTPDGEPLLLVMGLGGPMTWWEPDLCRLLADRGFHVIRFDNRDSGRSSRGVGRVTRTTLLRAAAGRRVRAPYALADMAEDAFGLLDHLGIESAHVCGVSMGGMIAQTMAIAHPKRVRSLTSIMSTTGKRTVGWQHPSLLPNFLGRRAGRDGYIEMSYRTWRIIGSPNYPTSEEQIRVRAAETFDRGVTASGTLRQMMAVLTQPNRSPKLRALTMPTLVVHGLGDKMVHVSGGRATAAAIPARSCSSSTAWATTYRRPSSRPSPTASVVRRAAHADSFSRQPPAGDAVRERSESPRSAPVATTTAQPASGASVVVDPGPKLAGVNSQSERRSPVSVSKTCTWCGSVVTKIVSPLCTVSRAEIRTMTLLGVPSTSQVP